MTDFSANYIPQYRTSTLNKAGGLNDSATTGIKVGSIPDDLDITKPGILALTWSNPVVTTSIEWITYTSIDGTNELQGVTRGAEGWSAKSHSDGATVAWVVSKSHVNEIMDALKGVKSGVTLLSPTITTPQINDTSSDHQYIFAASELTADRTVTLPLLTGADEFTFNAHTQTLTNKRVTKRVTTITSHATPTVNTDNCDAVTITALATAITSMTTNLSGTPTNFQPLLFRIKDDGSTRNITWGASFEAKGAALPTTTVLGKVLYVMFIYDTVTSKWGCVFSQSEA